MLTEAVVFKHVTHEWTRERCEEVAKEVEDEIVIEEGRGQLVSHMRLIFGLRQCYSRSDEVRRNTRQKLSSITVITRKKSERNRVGSKYHD
jgi:hypothetical protein